MPQELASCTTSERVTQTIKEYPEEVLLTAFATGALVGLAIGSAIASGSSSPSERSRRVAEGVGQRIMDSLDSLLPASVSNVFGKH